MDGVGCHLNSNQSTHWKSNKVANGSGRMQLTLGLLGNDVANVVLGTGTKNGSQTLGALLSLGAQVGIAIITGLLAVSDEVNGLGGSQRGAGKENNGGLHLGMVLRDLQSYGWRGSGLCDSEDRNGDSTYKPSSHHTYHSERNAIVVCGSSLLPLIQLA